VSSKIESTQETMTATGQTGVAKIKEVQFIIPIPNQPYTDARPLITGDSWDDIKSFAADIAASIGNKKLATTLGNNREGKEKICTDQGCLYLDRNTHEYEGEDGTKFISGSTWAHQFERPFDPQLIAPKVAERKLTTVDKVIEGWDMKSEVSLSYGTTVHKAVECAIKYNELPNNPHLATLAQDALDLIKDQEVSSEQFICSFDDHFCGIVDILVNLGNKRVKVVDLKTGDIYKKTSLTTEAKELWPDLQSKMISLYQLQLSFYAYILAKMGYKVDALEIWAEAAEAWEVVKLPVLDIRRALEAE